MASVLAHFSKESKNKIIPLTQTKNEGNCFQKEKYHERKENEEPKQQGKQQEQDQRLRWQVQA